MEYLTIQEPRTHHFREMDPYPSDAYDVRSRDAMPRPVRAPSYDHERSLSPSSRRSQPDAAHAGNDWQRWSQSKGRPSYSTLPTSTSTTSHPTYAPADPVGTTPSINGVSAYSTNSGVKPPVSAWSHPGQPIPVRPLSQTLQVLQTKEELACKLPSFTSLLVELERQPEPKGASPGPSGGTDIAAWIRQEPRGSFPPMEYPGFPLASIASNGSKNVSKSVTHQIASSEPTSPHVYTNLWSSPRLRAQSPKYRTRALSTLPAPASGREAHNTLYPATHHRTQTFPSFPAHQPAPEPPLRRAVDPFQPQLPYQHIAAGPSGSHHGSLPAIQTHSGGHSRNDSLLSPTDDIRFHSGSFYATGSNGSHYQRKRRGNLPKDATKVLRQWFDDHLQAPYPGEEVKNELCSRTGLQISQVNNWFINARRRLPRVDTGRNRRADTTDGSEGSPTRERQPPLPSAYP